MMSNQHIKKQDVTDIHKSPFCTLFQPLLPTLFLPRWANYSPYPSTPTTPFFPSPSCLCNCCSLGLPGLTYSLFKTQVSSSPDGFWILPSYCPPIFCHCLLRAPWGQKLSESSVFCTQHRLGIELALQKCLHIVLLLLFYLWVVSNSLWPHGLQHTSLPCPSRSLGVCSNSCPLSQWCHPTFSPSAALFSYPQSFPASRSFPVSWLFASGGQRIGASASVLPMNIQGWFPLGLTGLISLQSKGLSRVSKIFENTFYFYLSWPCPKHILSSHLPNSLFLPLLVFFKKPCQPCLSLLCASTLPPHCCSDCACAPSTHALASHTPGSWLLQDTFLPQDQRPQSSNSLLHILCVGRLPQVLNCSSAGSVLFKSQNLW